MHHLKYPQRKIIYQFIKETSSKCILVEPNPFNPMIFIQILIYPDMLFAEEIEFLKLTRGRFKKEFEKNGLSIKTYKPLCFLPPFIMNNLIRRVPINTLKCFEKFCSAIPGISSYQMITYEGKS